MAQPYLSPFEYAAKASEQMKNAEGFRGKMGKVGDWLRETFTAEGRAGAGRRAAEAMMPGFVAPTAQLQFGAAPGGVGQYFSNLPGVNASQFGVPINFQYQQTPDALQTAQNFIGSGGQNAGSLMGMGQQGQVAQQFYNQFAPTGVNEAQRQAVMNQLQQNALREEVGRQASLQQMGYGGGTSGTALALQQQGLQNLGSQRTLAEAGLQSEAAARELQARQLGAQMAQQRAFEQAGLGLQRFQTLGQLGLGLGGLAQQQAALAQQRGLAEAGLGLESQRLGLSAQESAAQQALAQAQAASGYDLSRMGMMDQRALQGYQAALLPWQAQQEYNLAKANIAAGHAAGQGQFMGALIGGGMSMAGQIGGGAIAAK